MSSSRASTRTCPAISPAVRLRSIPILPVRQKAHRIGAADLCRDAERLRGRIGDEDRFDQLAVGRAARRNFVVPSDGDVAAHDCGVLDLELRIQLPPAARGRDRSSGEFGDRRAYGSTETPAAHENADSPADRRLLPAHEVRARRCRCEAGVMATQWANLPVSGTNSHRRYRPGSRRRQACEHSLYRTSGTNPCVALDARVGPRVMIRASQISVKSFKNKHLRRLLHIHTSAFSILRS